MADFSDDFDSDFDTGASGPVDPPPYGPVLLGTGTASCGISVSVVSPLVFSSGEYSISWYATVVIGIDDISARLHGQLIIQAAETSARVASLSMTPTSVAQLDGFEGQVATIDLTLFRVGQTGTWRCFTGVVEGVSFNPASRIAELTLRDGYQERPAACASAAEVEALFGGMAFPCSALLPWRDTEPDPDEYFSGLLETFSGCCQIDSSGIWRAVPWHLGAPLASFTEDDVFGDSIELSRARRVDMPRAVVGTLTHRFPRLHSSLQSLSWSAVERTRYVVDGLPTLPKSMAAQAISNVPGWLIKGKPTMVQPVPGEYPVIVGPATVMYIVSYEVAQITCQSLSVDLYKRWYQDAEISYTVSIDLGGTSGRDDTVSGTITSTFDGSAWESVSNADASNDLYIANAPVSTATPTGYEGLPPPWPPANSAIDHFADIAEADIAAACRNIVARAVRRAAMGRRQTQVRFERPVDPRWEIGDVLAIDCYGVSGKGQLVDIALSLDHDSAEAISTLTLACPTGSGDTTGFSLTPTVPAPAVAHAMAAPPLGNYVGAHFDTPAAPDEDTLAGFLCNCSPASDNYDATAPAFVTQFRILMPEIPATVRDPIQITHPMTATINLADSGLTVSF